MKHGTTKTVTVTAHSFDCLPAYMGMTGRGSASTLRVAAARALDNIFRSDNLKYKRIGSFKAVIEVIK
jgi:hypothetical protein